MEHQDGVALENYLMLLPNTE